MWQISLIIVPILIPPLLSWIIYISVTEKGCLKKNKFITKWPKSYRILSIIGFLLFSFLLLMVYLTDNKKSFNFLYVVSLLFILIFAILCYISFRFKIVIDLNNNKVTVYRLFFKKRCFDFKDIYSLESKGEITKVKDSDGKVLFSYNIFLAGIPILDACLSKIIKCNIKQKPIISDEIKEIMQRNNIIESLVKLSEEIIKLSDSVIKDNSSPNVKVAGIIKSEFEKQYNSLSKYKKAIVLNKAKDLLAEKTVIDSAYYEYDKDLLEKVSQFSKLCRKLPSDRLIILY